MLLYVLLLVTTFEIVSGNIQGNFQINDRFPLQYLRVQQKPQLQLCQRELRQLQECQNKLQIRLKGQQSGRDRSKLKQSLGKHEEMQQPDEQLIPKRKPVFVLQQQTSEELTATAQYELLESPGVGQITELSETSVTFISSNKTANTINITDWSKGGEFSHIVQLSPEFNNQNYSLKLGSRFTNTSIQPSPGLVHTVLTAYKDHHNLVLTPDDVWTAIIIQFSRHMNAYAEDLRHLFVSHKGNITLSFEVNKIVGLNEDRSFLTEREWTRAINHFTSELEKKSKPLFSSFVLNNFTTTTERTRIVSGLGFMSAMKHYFKFSMYFSCGIPQITLLGTVDDWVEISNRVRLLREFGTVPTKWADLLSPIMNQFVSAKRGEVDGEFWGDIVRIQKRYKCGGGKPEEILDGWLAAFAVFDEEGKWRGDKFPKWEWPRVNLKDVASGVVTVPVELMWPDEATNAPTQDAIVFVGHMGHEISMDKKMLIPYSGWGVATSSFASSSSSEKSANFSSSVAGIRPNYTEWLPQ